MGFLQDLFLRAATGRNASGLFDAAANGQGPMPWNPQQPDKSVHALASMLMAQRIGQTPAAMVGVGKEAVQGLAAPFMGYSPLGEHGFDPTDIRANMYGIERARPTPIATALDMLMQRFLK